MADSVPVAQEEVQLVCDDSAPGDPAVAEKEDLVPPVEEVNEKDSSGEKEESGSEVIEVKESVKDGSAEDGVHDHQNGEKNGVGREKDGEMKRKSVVEGEEEVEVSLEKKAKVEEELDGGVVEGDKGLPIN